jgi:hypothetical protein
LTTAKSILCVAVREEWEQEHARGDVRGDVIHLILISDGLGVFSIRSGEESAGMIAQSCFFEDCAV